MPEYKLPDVGEGLTEAEIVTWKVKVGDVIAINDIVVEIETAKSLVELPSPYAGTVTGLLVPEGETVAVGTPIIAIAAEGEAPAPAARGPAATPQADLGEIDLSNPRASGGGEGESLVGRNKAERDSLRRPRKGTSPAAAAAQHSTHEQIAASFVPGELVSPEVVEADEPAVPAYTPEAPAALSGSDGDVRTLAKPPVRKLAKDLGVDITSLIGSGDGGVVTRQDVEAASARRTSSRPGAQARASHRRYWPGDPRTHQGRPQDDGAGDGRLGLLRPARHRVGHRRRDPDDGVRRPAQGPSRVPRREGLAAARAGARRRARRAAYARDQLLLGRACPGGRVQALRQPRHRGRDRARPGRAQRQGRPGPLAARPRRSPQPAHRDGPRRQDAAGRHERRHVHDHQRRGLRDRLRHPDHQPGRVRDPGLRRRAQDAVGGGRRRSSCGR